MKSAYELAMERLEKSSGPSKRLTDEQKGAIAAIDQKYDAKLAELRLGTEDKLRAATTFEEHSALNEALESEAKRIEERREREKEAVWAEAQ